MVGDGDYVIRLSTTHIRVGKPKEEMSSSGKYDVKIRESSKASYQ